MKGVLTLDELLLEYAERFKQNFPIFCMMGASENEVRSIIQKCLEAGIPYEPENSSTKTY